MMSSTHVNAFLSGESAFLSLPSYVQQKLRSCPHAGGGVHTWLYHVARLLWEHNVPSRDAVELLERATDACDRVVPGREITEAVRNSKSAGDAQATGSINRRVASPPGKERNAGKNYLKIERIARAGEGLRGLAAINLRDDLDNLRPLDVLPHLYPQDSLVCCGWSKKQCSTRPLSRWMNSSLDHAPFVVPNPMSALAGLTRDGRTSERCLGNTGPRRFLVIEFDFKEKNERQEDTQDARLLRTLANDGISVADLGVSLHLHLASFGNLVMIVHSGGKSEHGWYYVVGQAPEKIEKFMAYAVSLGADPVTRTLCQMIRMPGALREGSSVRQGVRFFEPGRISL